MRHDSPFSDPSAIDRLLAGEPTHNDAARFDAWREQDPASVVRFEALRSAVREPAGTLPDFDPDVRTAAIVEYAGRVVRRNQRNNNERAVASRTNRRYAGWYGLATIALAASLIGVVVWGRGEGRSSETMTRQTYQTHNAQRATVTLPDGSRAILGPASAITVTPEFASGHRTVTMSGEVHFSVTTNTEHPFLVNAGNSVVRVLGTTFTIRKYPDDRSVRVAVVDGKVALRSRQDDAAGEAILSAGSLGTASDSGQIVVQSNVDTDQYTSWIQGRIRFRDIPLRELVVELGRLYDANITIADTSLAAQVVTMGITTARQSVFDVLDELMLPLGAHYVRGDSVIMIRAGKSLAKPRKDSSILLREIRYGR